MQALILEFNATTVLLIAVGVISLVILANESVLYLRAKKQGGNSKSSKKLTPKAKRRSEGKKRRAKKSPSAAPSEISDIYSALETVAGASGVEDFEPFEPVSLDYDEADETVKRLSGKIRHVEEVESMRVGPVTEESIRSGKAVSEAWTPSEPVDDYVAGDVSGYYSAAGRQSLASQLREAHDSFEYGEVGAGSERIGTRDPSVRIVDTRIDSAAFRRSA